MNYYQSNNLSFNGLKIDDRIVCENCGWSWKVKDGGDDLYVCHKCNYDNSKFYLPKDNKYSNADYSEAITQGISAVGSIGSSIAQKKANFVHLDIVEINPLLGDWDKSIQTLDLIFS